MPDALPGPADIRSLRLHIQTSAAQIETGLKGLSNALQTLAAWEDRGLHDGEPSADQVAANAAAIRRARGGQGSVSKIDADPELRAFVTTRINSMGYAEIAQEMAATFGADRSASKSSIARWWSKNGPKGPS